MYTDKNFIAKDFIIVLVTDEASFREASHPPPPLIQMESGGGTGLGSVRFFCTILERNLSCFCRSRGQNTILFLIASILSQHFYHKHDNLVFFSPCFAYQKEGERRGGVVCAVSMNNPFFLSSLSLHISHHQ